MAPILHWTILQPQGTKIKKRQHIFWYLTILWWMRNDFNERINRWMFKILSSRRMYDGSNSYRHQCSYQCHCLLIWIDPMPRTACQIMDLKTKRDLRKNLKKTFSLNFSFPFCGNNRKIFQIQLKKKNGSLRLGIPDVVPVRISLRNSCCTNYIHACGWPSHAYRGMQHGWISLHKSGMRGKTKDFHPCALGRCASSRPVWRETSSHTFYKETGFHLMHASFHA